MTKYLLANAERSLGATIARMTACDGFPFQMFCTSPNLRKALMALGFSKLPNSPTTFKQMVTEHGSYVRALISGEINQLKGQGQRFSLTFDEWMSNRNR